MKNIVCIGDSFTYGDELPNRDDAWPHILARLNNWNVKNLGSPGGSNDLFLRLVFEEQNKHDLIILSWSTPIRTEILYGNIPFSISPSISAKMKFNWGLDYYKYYYSDYHAHFKWLSSIVMLQSYLKSINQPYVFCSTFSMLSSLDKETFDKYYPNLEFLINQVDKTHYIDWHELGMTDWMGDCLKAPGGHPLELGHQRIASRINEHIRNVGWLS